MKDFLIYMSLPEIDILCCLYSDLNASYLEQNKPLEHNNKTRLKQKLAGPQLAAN